MKLNPFGYVSFQLNSNIMKRILISTLLTLLPLTILQAQYQPLDHPSQWKLGYPTEAFDLQTGESLGTLQKGLELEVIATNPTEWTVRYMQPLEGNLTVTIRPPDLSRHLGMSFGAVSESIRDFPLLMALLESDNPWNERLKSLSTETMETIDAWGIQLNYIPGNNESPSNSNSLKFGFDKGNQQTGKPNGPVVNQSQAHATITSKFTRLQRFFQLESYMLPNPTLALAKDAQRDESTRYVLPNDIAVTVRYQPGEYLSLEFASYHFLKNKLQPIVPDPYEIAEHMKVKKWSSGGHLFLPNIPMIHQRDRGDGAAPTLARLLQFYGYPVDMRQLDELAQLDTPPSAENVQEFDYDQIIHAANQFCQTTPFQMYRIGQTKHSSYQDIYSCIQNGQPILMLAPGHIHLIIGIHPQTREVVYSDSWGAGHEFKTMSWDTFENINRQMWVMGYR